MSTAGAVLNDFPVPTRYSGLLDITVGPDKNLWFTEAASGLIGRITSGVGR